MSLMLTCLKSIPMIQPGDRLADILVKSLEVSDILLEDGDVLVLAQKIVSKAEGRFFNLNEIDPSEEALQVALKTEKDPRFVELVLRESNSVMRTRPGTLIVEHRLGFVCANAGIDHSNVQGLYGNPEDWVLLLPENPDRSAQIIRTELEHRSGKKIGVLIIDSHGRAWRMGTIGTTIGAAGIPCLVDMRGTEDLLGYKLKVTEVAAADELAGAASLLMGQAAEGTPVVHVRGFPFPLRDGRVAELIRPHERDMFR